MPTSGSCRPNESQACPAARVRGFSLLELLVVLALIGMLTAVVAPRLQKTYDAIAGSGEREEVRRQLARLPLLARSAGEPIQFAKGAAGALAARVRLPEGWVVRPLEPVRIEASGVCHAARLQIEGRGSVEEVVLTAPACEVRDAQ